MKKIVREHINEIKRSEDVRSTIGVGRMRHLSEFFKLISEDHLIKVNQDPANEWKDANVNIANRLGCNVSELRFTSFYYDDNLWGKMEDWFGPSDGDIEIGNKTHLGQKRINGRVWNDGSMVVFKFEGLVMGNKTYYQIYISETGMNILGIKMNSHEHRG